MDSPLLKFLEWYQDLPILHQRKLALFIMKSNDVSTDDEGHETQSGDKWTVLTINRFMDEICEVDKRMSNAYIPPVLKWEGMKLVLFLRSQVDYLLSHDGFYYSLEGIDAEYSVFSHSFTSTKIKGFQKSQRAAVHEKKEEMVAQLQNIHSKWEIFRNQFLNDEYIDKWCRSS